MRRLILTVVMILMAAPIAAWSQPQIPPDSLDKLQEIFSLARDYLWQVDDHFWHRGEFERCIATMRLITQVDPHDIEAYADTAWLMQNALRDDEAEAFLLEGLAKNRDTEDMYWELGYFYHMHMRFDEAIDYLEHAVTFDPHWRTWHLLAHSYEHAGHPGEALNIWLRMEGRDPRFIVPQIQIERILAGGPPSMVPEMARHAREEREKAERQR